MTFIVRNERAPQSFDLITAQIHVKSINRIKFSRLFFPNLTMPLKYSNLEQKLDLVKEI